MTGQKLSWGRFPRFVQHANEICWPQDVSNHMTQSLCQPINSTLAFGMGRSYGDSCLAVSDQVLLMRGMDRMLSANWEDGVIHAHAGLTLDQLINITLPQGWFLPVTPGTRFVTLGGAVANDVHGKNHHSMGTFGRHVSKLTLFRSVEGEVTCSADQQPDLFAATVGGLGLTGVILSVELQLQRVISNQINQRCIKFGNLEEFFALSEQYSSSNEYSVAWIDCLARNKKTGRGHYLLGNHAKQGALHAVKKTRIKMPFDPSVSMINKATLKSFNALYYHRQIRKDIQSLVRYDSFFYPLDAISGWNKMYGKQGFQQYQCVIPDDSAREVILAILNEISRSGTGSFLAVLKQFGNLPSPGILSFPMSGATLALDFPQREPENMRLFEKLDALVHEARGRLYPAKDAHMSAVHFQQAYPDWQRVENLRDPRLLSRFWQRVTQ